MECLCSSKYKQDQIQLLGNGQPHYPAFGYNLHIICRQTQNIKCPTLQKKKTCPVWRWGLEVVLSFHIFSQTLNYYPRLRSQASSHTIKLTGLPTCTVFFHVHQPKHLLWYSNHTPHHKKQISRMFFSQMIPLLCPPISIKHSNILLEIFISKTDSGQITIIPKPELRDF